MEAFYTLCFFIGASGAIAVLIGTASLMDLDSTKREEIAGDIEEELVARGLFRLRCMKMIKVGAVVCMICLVLGLAV